MHQFILQENIPTLSIDQKAEVEQEVVEVFKSLHIKINECKRVISDQLKRAGKFVKGQWDK